MPRKCCIEGCSNFKNINIISSGSKVSFHLFPKDEELNLTWKHYIRVCNNQEITSKSSIVCSDHFQPSDIIKQQSKSILKSFAVPKIFPNSSSNHDSSLLDEDGKPSDDVRYSHEAIELPVFVSVDESPLEPDRIPSTMQEEMNIEPSNDNIEKMTFVSVSQMTYDSNPISNLFPIKKEIIEILPPDDAITTMSTTEEANRPAFVINNEPSHITSEFVIKDEIDEDSSPGNSTGDCEIVEPPNSFVNTFTNAPIRAAVTLSNLSMCPSLNPPMHPSLNPSMYNSNVVKCVPLSEYKKPSRQKVVRYPGDIDLNADITPEDARKNLSICKTKITAQAKEIYRLKQKVHRQKVKIDKMKDLLKKFKTHYERSIDDPAQQDDQ